MDALNNIKLYQLLVKHRATKIIRITDGKFCFGVTEIDNCVERVKIL